MPDGKTPAKLRRARKADAPTTSDSIEFAMQMEAAGPGPGRSAAIDLLVEQRRLVRWDIADRGSGVLLKILSAVAGLVIAAALGLMAWQASRADGLVVEAFSMPPDFAARGLTGQVVASQLLDQFGALQAATDSIRPTQRSANGWDQHARVEIPRTGVSIDELQRFLRQWLGHERHINGEVVRASAGLQLTVRLDGVADTVAGTEIDISPLLLAGAERLYDRIDPTRYAVLLIRRGQWAEAEARLRRLTQVGPIDERAYAYVALGLVTPDHAQAIAYDEQADRLSQFSAGAGIANAAARALALGHNEQADVFSRRAVSIGMDASQTPSAHLLWRQAQTTLALAHGDPTSAFADWLDGPNLRPANAGRAPVMRAQILTAMHEPGRAQQTLGAAAEDGPLTRGRIRAPNGGGVSTAASGIARERGDWLEALRQVALARAAVAELPPAARAPGIGVGALDSTELAPRMAEALAELGRLPEARALIATTPLDCYLCLRIRGRVAALAGQPREADRWYAEAARQAPSLPQADLEWGDALLARGDAAGAIARFAAAHRVGPRFADPLERWGEALLAMGATKDAASKFTQAETFAPHWGRLRLKQGEALARRGDIRAAGVEWRAAAAMDLTVPDRARLQSLMAGGAP